MADKLKYEIKKTRHDNYDFYIYSNDKPIAMSIDSYATEKGCEEAAKEITQAVEKLQEENALLLKVRNTAMELYANRYKVTDSETFDVYLELMKIGRADIPYCDWKLKQSSLLKEAVKIEVDTSKPCDASKTPKGFV